MNYNINISKDIESLEFPNILVVIKHNSTTLKNTLTFFLLLFKNTLALHPSQSSPKYLS